MSKPNSRPHREARKQERKQLKEKIKQSRQELRKRQEADGIFIPPQVSVSNALSPHISEEEERTSREGAVAAQVSTFRAMLPILLKRFEKIPDPRNPKKLKHKITVLILYGILCFVFQMASRREATQTMSRPVFFGTLKLLFPELESMPHSDTLHRLLEKIDVQEIEIALIELIRHFIRGKKFKKFLISNCYPVAIDGTQKCARASDKWAEEWLERRFQTKEGEKIQRYVYVLEANLVFHNGLTLPLVTEFLSYAEGDPDDHKQDCELKAFHRLAKRIHGYFPRLPIMVLLDGLYPNGPLMQVCNDYNWQFMIVLPNKCLPYTWKVVEARQEVGLIKELKRIWKGRKQHFQWTNNIEHFYDGKKMVSFSFVSCKEEFEEVDEKTGDIVKKEAFHAWISSHPLHDNNVHERCNLGARYRWGIENSIQTEKCGGYNYEHVFSYSWNAMKGYHYLMRLAHMMNAIALHTKRAAKQVRTMGIHAFLVYVKETCAHPWLRPEWIKELLLAPFQLRLV